MDKILKVKLSIVILVFLVSLFFYKSLLFVEPRIYSYYPLSSVIISAISLGMILSVVAYNISIWFYSKEKQHLYYALAQLSVLFFLVTLESLYLSPFDVVYGFGSLRLHSLSHVLILLFSMLFIREFLHTREIKKLDFLVVAIIYASLADIVITLVLGQNIITGLIPIFVPIWLVVSESSRLIVKKSRPYYLFYFGWNMVIVTSVLVYTGLTGLINSNFPFLHIAFSIEAILLSLALTYKIKLLQDEKEAGQSLLLQQSRLASMGEMVASIAHQWRQPLTHLSFVFMNIKKNSHNPQIVEKKLKEANKQLSYMSKTIDDFRNFYNPSKSKEEFDIKEAISNTLSITSHSLKNADIEVEIKELKSFTLYANKNEFEQAILNIINNARDAKCRKIEIVIDNPTIMITDDGGGIEKKYLEKIFNPYFSTKKGSDGIGLYIAKTIIEKEMGGKLLVKASLDKTTFIIIKSKEYNNG